MTASRTPEPVSRGHNGSPRYEQQERPDSAQDLRFRATLELSPVGIAHVGVDGRWLWVNHKLCDILGYTRDQLERLTFQDITHPEDLAADLTNVRSLLAGDSTSYSMEKRYLRGDGSTVWAHLTVSLVRSASDAPDYFIAVVEDVGDRKQLEADVARAEQAAAAQARELDATIEAIVDGVSVYDAAGNLVRINAAGRALLGVDAAPTYFERSYPDRSTLNDVRDLQNNPTPFQDWPIHRVLRGETISSADAVELAVTTLDGRPCVLSFTGAPIRDAAGLVERAVIVYRDMTDRWQADHEREHMLNTVSHELRTPLTAMKARSQMLHRQYRRGSLVSDDQFEQLSRDVERLERLVNDLNEAARAGQGTVELSLERCDMRTLCQQVVEELTETSERNIALDMPRKPLETEVDCSRIEQVIANLVGNAIKYSPPDAPVAVTLRRRGGNAHLAVRDEGTGISADALPHVFERFYRAPGAQVLSGPTSSLGLGLYICKVLVEQHGGRIGVESKQGRGSTFWFTVPIRGGSTPENA